MSVTNFWDKLGWVGLCWASWVGWAGLGCNDSRKDDFVHYVKGYIEVTLRIFLFPRFCLVFQLLHWSYTRRRYHAFEIHEFVHYVKCYMGRNVCPQDVVYMCDG